VEHFKVIGERLSNSKRWGSDDQRGTLNFITPDRVVEASACIRTGKVFELSIPLCSDGPQKGLGEIFDLEALADDCASDGVWEFFLRAPPLRVVGGVGSPVSPVAVK
jgi:hypothetical protein